MSTLQNKQTLRDFYDHVVNERKFYLVNEYVDESFTDHNPEPGQDNRRTGIKPMFQGFVEAFPDLRMTYEHMVAEGDLVCARCTIKGTHLGTFNGVAPTGRNFEIQGFDWARFKNGKMTERWGVFDMASVMTGIGAVPGPSVGDLKNLSKSYYQQLDTLKGDIAGLRNQLLHPALETTFAGQPTMTIENVQGLLQTFWKAFPDIRHEVTGQVCEGNTVYNRMVVSATHKGAFAGVEPTNKTLKVDVMSCQTWQDGLLTEQWINIDMVGLLGQIGALKK